MHALLITKALAYSVLYSAIDVAGRTVFEDLHILELMHTHTNVVVT